MTFRYMPTFTTLDELERWADENDVEIVVAERGPDFLIRGVVRLPDQEAQP